MSYFQIRKRKRLQYLPPELPVLERAGSSDGDFRLQQSRRWLEFYHQEREAFKQEKASGKGKEVDARAAELGDAPSEHSEGSEGEHSEGSAGSSR